MSLCMQKSHNWSAKQFETMQLTLSYKATVVLMWYVSGLKLMVVSIVIINEAKHNTFQVRGVHCETNRGPCVFSLCYFNSSNCRSLFSTFSSQHHCNAFRCRQMPCLAQALPQTHCLYQSLTGRKSRWNNMAHRKHSIDVSKYNFFDSLVIFIHYFAGNRKVSCILATISNWFPNKKILKQKLCRGFLQLLDKTRVASWQSVLKI